MIRRKFGRTLARLLAVMALLVLVGPPRQAEARGDDPAVVRKAEAVATEAKLLFQQKAYEAAAERFMEAYTMVHRAPLIFNAARAYQEAGLLQKAVALFKAYASLPDANEEGKADAADRVAKLEAQLKAQEPKAADPQIKGPDPVKVDATPLPAHATPAGDPPPNKGLGNQAQHSAHDGKPPEGSIEKGVQPPAPRRFPWSATAATAGLALSSGVLYALALSEALAAHDMEATLRTTAQGQLYQEHVAKAETFRGAAVVTGTLTLVAAGWLGWELFGPAEADKGSGDDKAESAKKATSWFMALPTLDGAAVSWTRTW